MIDQFVASRGEWFSAQMLAQMLGYDFIDAAEFIAFEKRGHYSHEATRKNAARIDLMTRAARGASAPSPELLQGNLSFPVDSPFSPSGPLQGVP